MFVLLANEGLKIIFESKGVERKYQGDRENFIMGD
jgi:hypothetical protein